MSKRGRELGVVPNDALRVTTGSAVLRVVLETFALQDLMMLAYLGLVALLLAVFGVGPYRESSAHRLYLCAITIVLVCFAARANGALSQRARDLVYRLGLSGVLLENYLMLREVLPAIRPDAVDAQLHHIDLVLFRVEPSLWLERLNQPRIVEWFAFFYFSYFFIAGTYLVTVVFLTRSNRVLSEFAIGTFIVFCLGQLGYLAVPATGPTHYLVDSFHGPVQGGFFWSCVQTTVAAGSAMKDVFPSLHTAVPTWFVWFASRQARTDARWKWPRNVTLFFAANIVFSTVFLRWHYLIDVFAGLALSSFAGWMAPRLVEREAKWRRQCGFSPVWELRGPDALPAGSMSAPPS